MSSSAGPIKWIWPAPGEDTPPYSVEALFGPVARQDSIELKFSPASYNGNLTLYCAWQDGQQGIVWNITGITGSPFTYTFNETTPDGDDVGDQHICHFFAPGDSAPGGSGGNTQTFKFLDTPSKQALLWTQGGSSPKPTASPSASASATQTAKPTSTAEPVEAHPSNQPAITTGAAIGITLGAIAVIAIVGFLVWFLRRRSRRRRSQQHISNPLPASMADHQHYEHYNDKHGSVGSPAPPYGPPISGPVRGYSTKRVGELEGQQRMEMDGTHSSGPVIRSELPGS